MARQLPYNVLNLGSIQLIIIQQNISTRYHNCFCSMTLNWRSIYRCYPLDSTELWNSIVFIISIKLKLVIYFMQMIEFIDTFILRFVIFLQLLLIMRKDNTYNLFNHKYQQALVLDIKWIDTDRFRWHEMFSVQNYHSKCKTVMSFFLYAINDNLSCIFS